MSVTAVTVTYGKRWHLLERTLRSAFEDGATDAIVIDNASSDEIAAGVNASFPGKVECIRLDSNHGSAGGYAAGMQAALRKNAQYILLLDDDNCVQPGAISTLEATFVRESERVGADKLVILAFRPEHQPDVLEGKEGGALHASPDSFLDFHIKDVAAKLWRRRPGQLRATGADIRPAMRPFYKQRVAPYSGMFFHRSLLERFGIANPEFVLYQDDIEFSYRITRGGGEILLVPGAQLHDQEQSWSVAPKRTTSFAKWLEMGSDRQVYYTVRNRAFFETHCRTPSTVYAVNRAVYLMMLRLLALRSGKLKRVHLILNAIRDGEVGKLGLNHAFPLTH